MRRAPGCYADRTWFARGPLGLASISNVTCSPPTSRSKSRDGFQGAAMEEVFLLILGSDETEAAVSDDLLDGTGGHDDLQHFPNAESRAHGPFEKGATTRSRCWTQRNLE